MMAAKQKREFRDIVPMTVKSNGKEIEERRLVRRKPSLPNGHLFRRG